jgi:thioesterase domain-containing protein
MTHGKSYVVEKLRGKLRSKSRNISTNPDELFEKDIRKMMRMETVSSFSPSQYSGKIMLFKATGKDRWPVYKVDPLHGWDKLAKGGIDVVEIPSSHLGILQDPYVQDITDHLRKHL